MDWISNSLPWYVAGPLIGLMVPILLIWGNKHFGISSSLRHICASMIPTKAEYFNYNWKESSWNLVLALGVVFGGFIGYQVLGHPEVVPISESTVSDLQALGITDFSGLIPAEIFSVEGLTTVPGILMMIVGGFLVGFGTRYANGCTSGHAIMGISMLNPASVVATIGFFIGGLIVTHLILPLILN